MRWRQVEGGVDCGGEVWAAAAATVSASTTKTTTTSLGTWTTATWTTVTGGACDCC